MVRHPTLVLLCVMALGILLTGTGAWPETLLPMDALEKLGESAEETCPTCVRALQKEAFGTLSHALDPGRVIRTAPGCMLVRNDWCAANELMLTCHLDDDLQSSDGSGLLPQVVFRFHTDQDHLVGIDPEHYTPGQIADIYQNTPIGTVFTGTVEIIPFRYGDGPSFLYSASELRLQIHCRILALEPAPADVSSVAPE